MRTILCGLIRFRFEFMLVFVGAFTGEAVITIVSVANEQSHVDNFTAVQSLYLIVNFISLLAVIVLFARLANASDGSTQKPPPVRGK